MDSLSTDKMSALLSSKSATQARTSTETDRRHLLADSVAPSESASMIYVDETEGDRTPRAQSPARSSMASARRETIADPTPRPYRGFPSEEAYLDALREWAESKKYIQYDRGLQGFYGSVTMQDYASRPPVEIGLKKKWRARKARKEEKKEANKQSERRNTVA